MKVKEVISVIEDFAPLSIQESWDNSGLVIGSPEQEVHGVLLGFDCTADLVDEAVERGADMIVTHHPLIFGGSNYNISFLIRECDKKTALQSLSDMLFNNK